VEKARETEKMEKVRYIFADAPLGGRGNVHLVAAVLLTDGHRIVRRPGEVICKPGKRFQYVAPAERDDFLNAPCPECVEMAERLGAGAGLVEKVKVHGPRVALYTTAPERLDRPKCTNKGVVGFLGSLSVRRVLVPKDDARIMRSYYQSGPNRCFTKEQWDAALSLGRAVSAETAGYAAEGAGT
jgi:hypothetical protein